MLDDRFESNLCIIFFLKIVANYALNRQEALILNSSYKLAFLLFFQNQNKPIPNINIPIK